MNKEEIIRWAQRYETSDSEWSSNCEKEIGLRIRTNSFITKRDLEEVINWKFQSMQFRKKHFLSFLDNIDEESLKNDSGLAFDESNEINKVNCFLKFKGIGVSLTSVILTFYEPKSYGVFDIHVWRELFGKEPKIFYKLDNYLRLLEGLRTISKTYDLDVRYIEKALFQKNLEESK